jgi:hypothetical protein
MLVKLNRYISPQHSFWQFRPAWAVLAVVEKLWKIIVLLFTKVVGIRLLLRT